MNFISKHYSLARSLAVTVAGLFLYSRHGFAAADTAPSLPIGSTELLNVGGGLIAVVIAIIVLGVIYARTQGLRSGSGGVINIVATQAIGPKERIAIVEVANKQLLIGMTTTSVQTLHVFEDPVAVEAEQKVSFSERLKTIAQNSKAGAAENEHSN